MTFMRRPRQQRGGRMRYKPIRVQCCGNIFPSPPFVGHWPGEAPDVARQRQRQARDMLRAYIGRG